MTVSSTSLPSYSPAQNGPPSSPQEEVQLKAVVSSGSSSEPSQQQNNIKGTPSSEYSTLEQIEECSQVSTTAVCNNTVRRGSLGTNGTAPQHLQQQQRSSPRLRPQSQQQHSPQFSQQRLAESSHHKSSTLPSAHSSPRSSRTNSLSSGSSPQNSRLNRSRHKIVNKYSEDPILSTWASGSPQTRRSAMSNRLSGQSDVQSDLSDRSTRDTLV